MEVITKLTVVNECLKTMSEASLNTLINEDHPYIAAALSCLDLAIVNELASPWWFNTEFATLYPDAVTKRIHIPQRCLDIDPSSGGGYWTARGAYIYDRSRQSYEFDEEVHVKYMSYLEFDELPAIFKSYVMYAAVLDFCSSFDADAQRVQEINMKYSKARMMVKSADTRNKNINMFDGTSYANKLNGIAWPGSTASRARNSIRR